ncbi:MAG TPA: ATP-binding protein [Polyangiaceae bacterium]|nr:ATP-binding protein [Polyangiaceae bacterium]
MGFSGSWRRITEAWIPPGLGADRDARRRAELLVALVIPFGMAALVRGASLLIGGLFMQGVLSTALAAWMAFTLGVLKRKGSLMIVGNSLVLGLFAVGASAAWQRGGVGAPVLLATGLLPLFALFLSGVSSGIAWGALYAALVLGLAGVEVTLGHDIPDRLPASHRLAVETLGALLFGFVVFALGLAYEWTKNAAIVERAAADRRTADAEEKERMVRADRMATVGQLAAGVAHEVNNPLAYIAANVEFAEQEILRLQGSPADLAEVQNALAEARQGIERVGLIVRDLKTFSRDPQEAASVVDVRDVLGSAIRIADNEVRHRAELTTSFPDAPVWTEANEARLLQVFLNLLLNAAQAIAPGRANDNSIRVSLSRGDSGNVEVSIRDTGCGMTADVLARATEPFFTTKPIGIGTGLGLSVCANVVRALGGDLRFESAPGQGTLALVTLECASEPAVAPKRRVSPSAAPGGARRILLIDDDPLVVRGLKRLLRGHDVTSASGGEEAVALVEHEHAFDVILCDLMMPHLTGADVYDAIEKLGRGFERNMVFLTGGTFTDQLRSFLERVENPRYMKPIRQSDIDAILVRGSNSD